MTPEGRRIVELAREASTPSAEDRRRIRAAVALGVAAAVGAPATSAAAASAKATGLLAMLASVRGVVTVVALATASAGAGAVWWSHRGAASVRETIATAPTVTPVAAVPVPVAPAAPIASEPAVTLPELPAEPQPADVHARAPSTHADPLVAELSLLRQARKAWQDGKAQMALDLAEEHAHRYPRSQLGAERDALEVFALCGLGRTTEAHDLATALVSRAPGSPLRASLEQSCAFRSSK